MAKKAGGEEAALTLDLRGMRREAGISLEKWNEQCGVCKSNLARYELGDVPSLKNALKIAHSLKMPVEAIWKVKKR